MPAIVNLFNRQDAATAVITHFSTYNQNRGSRPLVGSSSTRRSSVTLERAPIVLCFVFAETIERVYTREERYLAIIKIRNPKEMLLLRSGGRVRFPVNIRFIVRLGFFAFDFDRPP